MTNMASIPKASIDDNATSTTGHGPGGSLNSEVESADSAEDNSQEFSNAPEGGSGKSPVQGWIEKYCPGKTFADVGGLWGLVGQKVTYAIEAGATQATMIDFLPAKSPWWQKLEKQVVRQRIPKQKVRFQPGRDLERRAFPEKVGQYDVVNCAGVLYHVPNIFACVGNLWQITREYLMIATQVLPSTIETASGKLVLPEGSALCVPSLSDRERQILAEYYDAQNYRVTNINRGEQAYFNPATGGYSFGPSYWLGTQRWLEGVMESAPFKVIDGRKLSDHGVALLCRRETGRSTMNIVASPAKQKKQ